MCLPRGESQVEPEKSHQSCAKEVDVPTEGAESLPPRARIRQFLRGIGRIRDTPPLGRQDAAFKAIECENVKMAKRRALQLHFCTLFPMGEEESSTGGVSGPTFPFYPTVVSC